MPRVYVGIGSNIDREKNIRGAVRALAERFEALALSKVYESKAEGFLGEDFYNLVAGFDTGDALEAIRLALADIEAVHGRRRTGNRYAPRTLDVDILLYGDTVRHDAEFDIPRREILDAAYVLRPLAELAPDVRHPENGRRFADLWQSYGRKTELREVMRDLRESFPEQRR